MTVGNTARWLLLRGKPFLKLADYSLDIAISPSEADRVKAFQKMDTVSRLIDWNAPYDSWQVLRVGLGCAGAVVKPASCSTFMEDSGSEPWQAATVCFFEF